MRAVIFDLDGTICDPSGRLYHLDGEKDWKSFHAAAGDDTPIDPIVQLVRMLFKAAEAGDGLDAVLIVTRSEEHTSELQSLMRISYAVFCLKKKTVKQEKQSK